MVLTTLDQVYEEFKKDSVNLQTKYDFVHKKTKGKNIRTTIGKIWFNLIMPEDEPFYDEQIDKKKLNKIVGEFSDKYTPEQTSNYLTLINKEAYKLTSIFPRSFAAEDFVVPKEILDKKQKLVDRINKGEEFDFDKELGMLIEEFFVHLKKLDSGLYDLIISGAKGDPKLVGALTIAKGSSVDIEGNITSYIHQSQNTGYDLKNFYVNANEAILGQYTKSVASQIPGAVARTVAYSSNNVRVTEKDCKTKKYTEYPIDKSNFKSIQGRYFLNPNTKKLDVVDDTKDFLIGQNIKMRSPIYCETKDGICEICYGKLFEQNGTKNVGLVASTMANTLGVNAAMSARHSSSLSNRPLSNFEKDISELK